MDAWYIHKPDGRWMRGKRLDKKPKDSLKSQPSFLWYPVKQKHIPRKHWNAITMLSVRGHGHVEGVGYNAGVPGEGEEYTIDDMDTSPFGVRYVIYDWHDMWIDTYDRRLE